MMGYWIAMSIHVMALSSVVQPFCTVLDMNNTEGVVDKKYSFEQPLNHFDGFDSVKLDQMFWEKCNLYEEGGPVFLSVGGCGPVTDPWPQESALENYARGHKALLFKVEHRYYGDSVPRSDDGYIFNLDLSNLKYLTTSQALADLANFIQTMNKVHPLLKGRSPPPRWVAFGCFYGGVLATWLRTKYPHLVFAAVTSSAPLLARHDSPEYIDDIADIIEDRRKDCGTELRLAMYSLKQNSVLEPCGNKPKADMAPHHETNILLSLVRKTALLAQNDTDIATFCDTMLNRTVDNPVERFIAGLTELGLNMSVECDHSYAACIDDYKSLDASRTPGELCPLYRKFLYQQCTEFGHFQALEKTEKCMPAFSMQQCSSIFGPQFSESFITDAMKRYNIKYGGQDVEPSRVVTVHGSLDPWRTLGLTSNKTEESPVFIIKGGTQCADQRLSQDPDTSTVQEEVSATLGRWLNAEEPPPTVSGHTDSQDSQEEESAVSWWTYAIAGLLVGCALLVVFVTLALRHTRQTSTLNA